MHPGMRMLFLALLAFTSFLPPARAAIGFAAPEAPGLTCRRAIAAAERAHDVPPHLLAAIARVESGRREPDTGAVHPWPWTINAEGEGHFFDTKAQAISAVRALQARGVRSIDVGCMQVNLLHHPDAFASLEQAFDPSGNADYAARFLRNLFAQTGAWPKATGMYHSATPELAEPYRQQVLGVWPEETRKQVASASAALTQAWGATMRPVLSPLQRSAAVHIIPLTRTADGGTPAGRDLASYRAMPVFGRPVLLPIR